MTGRLRSWVHVPDETGVMQIFGPDDVVPDWAAKQITNPKAWAEGAADAKPVEQSTPSPSEGGDDDRPPKGGAGSGIDAWRAYAEAHGFDVAEDATRDDIIAAVEAG